MGALWTGEGDSNAERGGSSAPRPRHADLPPRPSSLEVIYQLVIATLLGILAGLIAWIIATGVGFQG